MTNVLPREALAAQSSALRARLLFGVSATFTLAALILALAVAPAFISAQVQVAALNSEISRSKAAATQGEQGVLTAAQKRVAALTDVAKGTQAGAAITRLLADRSADISITNIQYQRIKSDTAKLTVSGNAKSRQSVQLYAQKLQTEPLFSSVSIPVSSLTTSEQGKFDLVITGAF